MPTCSALLLLLERLALKGLMAKHKLGKDDIQAVCTEKLCTGPLVHLPMGPRHVYSVWADGLVRGWVRVWVGRP